MIVVCDNTDIAKHFYEAISGEELIEADVPDDEEDDEDQTPKRRAKKPKAQKHYGTGLSGFPELWNRKGAEVTLRIDSRLLAAAESEDPKATRKEAAEELRKIVSTVGKPGEAGEHIRCVVSVNMLSEGWDASNVTHILGIRAFQSQLLCEQVVGRGLRRMNYTPDPVTKLLPAEYVDVYGIPFSLIPYKGRPPGDPPNDPVYHHIFALDERVEHKIGIPVVESYTYDIKGSGITCDVAKLEELHVKDEPTKVYLIPQKGYRDAAGDAGEHDDYVEQTRETFYASVRMQQLLFRFTQDIVDDLVAHGEG